MRAFFTSDTHLDHRFLQDLANHTINQSGQILFHAGDFLEQTDMGRYPLKLQIEHCQLLNQTISKHLPYVYCQGNHDIISEKPWLTPQRHQTITDLFVTTIPYPEEDVLTILQHGKKLFDVSPATYWVVLCHVPPAQTKIAGKGGSMAVRRAIEAYQPHLLLSGHHHLAPFSKTGHHSDSIGQTLCLNPGKKNLGRPNFFEITFSSGNLRVHWYPAKKLK